MAIESENMLFCRKNIDIRFSCSGLFSILTISYLLLSSGFYKLQFSINKPYLIVLFPFFTSLETI